MINKAIILAAGKGTRMVQETNGSSKEMLCINNEPIISLAIKEILDAGCKEIGVVINKEKKDILNYLTKEKEKGLPITIIYQEPTGLMDAIKSTKNFIGNNVFAVVLPDMYASKVNPLVILFEAYKKYKVPFVSLYKVYPNMDASGCYAETENLNKEIYIIKKIIANPNPKKPHFFGRYIFKPTFFKDIENIPHSENEVPILDYFIKNTQLYALLFDEYIYHTGTPKGYSIFKEFLNKEDK